MHEIMHSLCMEIYEARPSGSLCVPSMLGGNADKEVLPGIALGRPDLILSPAYWCWRCANAEEAGEGYAGRESSLHEELGFCLLGGYGVRVEVNNAFFRHLRERGVFEFGARPSEAALFDLLSTRIPVSNARGVKPQSYRFPRQKATRLARSLALADELAPERSVHEKAPDAFSKQLARDARCRSKDSELDYTQLVGRGERSNPGHPYPSPWSALEALP